MPPIAFPYSFYQDFYSPIIPIGLCSSTGWHKVWAYVDSGSAYSIFQEQEALRLSIDIEKGEKRRVKVGDGDTFLIFLHPLEVQIGTERFKASIGFSEELKVGFNIIGRYELFDRFKICFNDLRHIVTFETVE